MEDNQLLTSLDRRKSVSLEEVSKITGIGVRSLRRYMKKGLIPGGFQPGGYHSEWRFKRDEIEAWWAAQGASLEALEQGPASRPRKKTSAAVANASGAPRKAPLKSRSRRS
jgi:predicted DNA-binding transcriptional regulator AlpA